MLLPINDPQALPLVGHVYTDASGRKLRVDALDLAAKDGRQVVGKLTAAPPLYGEPQGLSGNYSTTLPTWAAIWRDKRPAGDPSRMKVGG